jgi:hypothetical protein
LESSEIGVQVDKTFEDEEEAKETDSSTAEVQSHPKEASMDDTESNASPDPSNGATFPFAILANELFISESAKEVSNDSAAAMQVEAEV